ncbi:MAG: hypothetical protein ACRD2L_01210 [Terriglobia bacterium]
MKLGKRIRIVEVEPVYLPLPLRKEDAPAEPEIAPAPAPAVPELVPA